MSRSRSCITHYIYLPMQSIQRKIYDLITVNTRTAKNIFFVISLIIKVFTNTLRRKHEYTRHTCQIYNIRFELPVKNNYLNMTHIQSKDATYQKFVFSKSAENAKFRFDFK